jgi:hypothetical protein
MKIQLLLAAAMVAGATHASAQSNDEIQNYVAFASTPAGALPPMLTNTLIDRLQNGASLALRYGNLARGDFNPSVNAFAVTGILPAGLGTSLRLTAGVDAGSCSGCETQLMLGAGGDYRILGSTMGGTSTSPMFTVSIDGELGYGNRDPGQYWSGVVGAPIALVQRGTGMQFVPVITPAFEFTSTSVNGSSSSGSGLMLGGGLGIYNMMSSVTVDVGIQHSFVNGARNVVGINLLFGGK